jgi:hypothetical protein
LGVLSALAETMWTTGVPDPRVTDDTVRAVGTLTGSAGSEWAIGDLATWLIRLDLLDKAPVAIAPPHRAAAEGRYAGAALQWRQLGEPFAEAMALGDAPGVIERSRGVELLDQLGATATADRLRAALRRDGVSQSAGPAAGEHASQPRRADQPATRRGQARGARLHERRDRRAALHFHAYGRPSRGSAAHQDGTAQPAGGHGAGRRANHTTYAEITNDLETVAPS